MKKIIAVVLAVCVAVCTVLSAVCFAVCADDSTLSERELCEAYAYVMNDFKNGDITYTEYRERINAITAEYYENNTLSDTLGKIESIDNNIAEAVEKYGDTAYQYVAGWISDLFNDYTTTTTIGFDMQGYGCHIHSKGTQDNREYWVYCEYAIYNGSTLSVYGDGYVIDHNGTVTNFTSNVPGSSIGSTYAYPGNSYFTTQAYGDIRNSDGTPNNANNDDVTTITTLNFDNATDQDLVDLVNDIYEELERQNPDLSNIEGLLAAIYYRLGTLDSDDDNTILGQIVSSINSLENSIENLNFESITQKIENNEINLEDLFGDFKFSIDFGDFFTSFETNISLYFTFQDENYLDTKLSDFKTKFNSEFAFIDNISDFAENLFDSFEKLWEENEE